MSRAGYVSVQLKPLVRYFLASCISHSRWYLYRQQQTPVADDGQYHVAKTTTALHQLATPHLCSLTIPCHPVYEGFSARFCHQFLHGHVPCVIPAFGRFEHVHGDLNASYRRYRSQQTSSVASTTTPSALPTAALIGQPDIKLLTWACSRASLINSHQPRLQLGMLAPY